MLGRVVKDDAMGGVTEKSCPGLFVEQDPGLAFLTQVDVQVGLGCYPAHQGFRLVNIEIIEHKVPAECGRVGGDHALDMGQKIGFGPGVTRQRCEQLTGHHISTEDERSRAVTDVLELTSFDFARRHRETRMFPFQRLHTGQLIGANGSLSLLMAFWCRVIGRTHINDSDVSIRIVWRRQPVADTVGLQVPLLSSR